VESEHNKVLQQHVHPLDYVNPEPDVEEYDMVVIGAGVSGLISVIIGAWLGKKCALIERHSMGGDCLNTGCVPSKALIACARAMHSTQHLSEFGVKIPEGEVTIDFNFVMERMRKIRAKISHVDSVERYSRDFCKHVFVGDAKFIGNKSVEIIGDDGSKRVLKYKKAMIAVGASAAIPPVPGLREIPFLTNSNFFNQTQLPPRMMVIGCGPIGLELSQAMARFGCKVLKLANNMILEALFSVSTFLPTSLLLTISLSNNSSL
jgi:pyruvate/2-oxoglutarate dehydrogenase complex dihydrolipoamide dehydrogenase (E3) component